MKTLFFCNLVPDKQGAFERFLASLAGEFKATGDRLLLALAGEPIRPVADALRDHGAEWRIVAGWNDTEGRVRPWAFVRPALSLLRRERPDVAAVHFGNELPSVATALMHRLSGGPRCRWVWQQDQQVCDPQGLSRFVSRIRMLTPFFSHFVAVYEGGRRSLVLRGVPAARISVINNAVTDTPPEVPRADLRCELGVPSDALLLAAVSSLTPRKRIDFLLNACAALLREEPAARLVVIGDGPDRSRLVTLASSLGIAERVIFAGSRNDVPSLLAASDIFVHAASAEACSYAVLESMAAGLPAVMTRAGAAEEQIVEGESGYVVAPGDDKAFAERIRRLASDTELRRRLGRAARRRWHEHYRLEDAARRYHGLYKRLAAPSAP
jgi:glycosyltransferase involved in cell wall biosynthesis